MTHSGPEHHGRPEQHGHLEQLLAAWLPAQRWFAGSGTTIDDVVISSDVQLTAGDPELRHLIADVRAGADQGRYQLLIALAAQPPAALADRVIGALPDGRIAYDGAFDPELSVVLLRGIASQRRVGQLRFATEPGAVIDSGSAARTLPALASNTSVVYGDRAILKLIRRPASGCHPDLEVPSALARGGSKLVAAPLGWIELAGDEPTVLAIMSEYFTNASDGWTLATASLTAGRPDFADQARLLGQATAQLHAELAAAFGTAELSRPELAELSDALAAELARAAAVVPQLRQYEADILACYAELAQPTMRVAVQRIHGDYHLAQVLMTDGGWVILDFEGEPSVPLARRRAFSPALRDVAGMLRSFDYAARHQVMQRQADQALPAIASDWVSHCQQAFLAGYVAGGGGELSGDDPLLRALTFAKAVYEAVYEARHRPDWLPIPLAALAEART